MKNPYHAQDSYEQVRCVMAEAQNRCYESICEQLLSRGDVVEAVYLNGEMELHTVTLVQILEDYAEEIEGGIGKPAWSIKKVIEAEAKRIAESIF